jgi:hypothetical protein
LKYPGYGLENSENLTVGIEVIRQAWYGNREKKEFLFAILRRRMRVPRDEVGILGMLGLHAKVLEVKA